MSIFKYLEQKVNYEKAYLLLKAKIDNLQFQSNIGFTDALNHCIIYWSGICDAFDVPDDIKTEGDNIINQTFKK